MRCMNIKRIISALLNLYSACDTLHLKRCSSPWVAILSTCLFGSAIESNTGRPMPPSDQRGSSSFLQNTYIISGASSLPKPTLIFSSNNAESRKTLAAKICSRAVNNLHFAVTHPAYFLSVTATMGCYKVFPQNSHYIHIFYRAHMIMLQTINNLILMLCQCICIPV